MPARLSIGLVARRTGATVPTIRYYEEIGLLPAAARTESGQRHYDEATVDSLVFIRRCREFGFSIDQVRELVKRADAQQGPCSDLRDVAAARLTEVREKLAELGALEATLAAIVGACNAGCVGGAVADCNIPGDLKAASGAGSADDRRTCCS
jgi:MerR family copper efflux transcriptional regulator